MPRSLTRAGDAMEQAAKIGPTIEVKKDGPYVVTGGCRVYDATGKEVPARSTFALCRCGNSSRKPFCDGTHAKIGFSGMRFHVTLNGAAETYPGKQVMIHDDRALCAHAGVCTDNLAVVFRIGKEPWIDATAADVGAIIAVVKRCPSGALSYSIRGVTADGGMASQLRSRRATSVPLK